MLVLERSLLEMGPSDHADMCEGHQGGGRGGPSEITAESLARRLGCVVGDDNEDNAAVLMEFLVAIGSEQGVRDYLEEVLLEQSVVDESAWDEMGPLPRDIAFLMGWSG